MSKRRAKRPKTIDAEQLIARLPSMNIAELRELWPRYFEVPPFTKNRALMAHGIAYRVREEAFGAMPAATRRKLEAIHAAMDAGLAVQPPRLPRLRPGTRLLRCWQGVVHEVLATTEGFRANGRIRADLGDIAREITGDPASGVEFFGVREGEVRQFQRHTRERLP